MRRADMKHLAVLIDNGGDEADLGAYWRKTGFEDRVRQLSLQPLFWRGSVAHGFRDSVHGVGTREDLLRYLDQKRTDAIVYLSADQYFFDPKIAARAVDVFNSGDCDYVSQWEHCRLPAGVGIRVVSTEALKRSGKQTPGDAITHILSQPDLFRSKYDPTIYCDSKQSLFDTRTTGRRALEIAAQGIELSLSGALEAAGRGLLSRHTRETDAPRCDVRGISAGYGFESYACSQFPTYVMFDITDQCNSRCVHCPHSVAFGKHADRAPRFLELELYRRAIDECSEHEIGFIRITADGEPILHPRCLEMIEYAAKREVGPVGLTTNGSLLDEEAARRLVESGAFLVDISIDAAREETYKKIRKGLPFKRVIGNVERLIQLRNKSKSSLKIMVSFVKQQLNLEEAEEFDAYWKPYVDQVLFREMTSNVNLVEVSGRFAEIKRWPCPHWFRRTVVNYEGMIKACPIDWENKTLIASLDQTTLYDAWHSDEYCRARIEHLNGEVSPHRLCFGCADWATTPWHLGYEKAVKRMTAA